MSEKKTGKEKSNYFFYMTRHPKHMDVPTPPDFVQKLVTGTLSVALVTSMTPVVSFADEQDRAFSDTRAIAQLQSQEDALSKESDAAKANRSSLGSGSTVVGGGSLVASAAQQGSIATKQQIADSLIQQISEKIVVDQVEYTGNAIALHFKIDDDALAQQYTLECRIVDDATDFGTASTGAKVIERQHENGFGETIEDTVAFDVADSSASNLALNLGAVRFVIKDAQGIVAESYQNLTPIQLKSDRWSYIANDTSEQNASANKENATESERAEAEKSQAVKEQALLARALKEQQVLQAYIAENNLDLSDIDDPSLVVESLLKGSVARQAVTLNTAAEAAGLTLSVVDDSLAWVPDSYSFNNGRLFPATTMGGSELSSFALSVADANNPNLVPIDSDWEYVDGEGNAIADGALPVIIEKDSSATTGQYQFTIKKKTDSFGDETVALSDIYIQYTVKDSSTTEVENLKIALTEILGVDSFVFDTTAPTIIFNNTGAEEDLVNNRTIVNAAGQSLITISDDNLAALIDKASLPSATDDLKNMVIATLTDKSNSSIVYTLTLGMIASSSAGKACVANKATSVEVLLKANTSKEANEVLFENGVLVVPDGEYTVSTSTDLKDVSGNRASTSVFEDLVFKGVSPEITIDTASVQNSTQHDGTYYFNRAELLRISIDTEDLTYLSSDSDNKAVLAIKGSSSQGQSIDNVITIGDIKDASSNSVCIAIGDVESSAETPLISLPEGKYTITFLPTIDAPIVDAAGNALKPSERSSMTSENSSIEFVYDVTAPTISKVTSNKNYANSYANDSILFHKEQTTLTATVGDQYGLMQEASFAALWKDAKVAYDVAGKASGSVVLDLADGQELTPLQVLTVTDYAGNSSYWAISSKDGTYKEITQGITYQIQGQVLPETVVQDTVLPLVSLSGVTAGAYYKNPVTARLDVSELNFSYLSKYDSSQNVLIIDKESADPSRSASQMKITAGQMKSIDTKAGKYYFEKTIDSDGHYAIKAQVVDPAGNVATTQVGEFTVDRTAPTIDFSWDNNDVQNGKYYKAGRTATVTIVEHNFDPSLVKIDAPGGSIGSWSNNGDTHTIKVNYGSDAVCGLSVDMKDKAGNAASKHADEFVIDTTAPTIVFAGIGEGHAYNGEVTPIIEFADEANFNPAGTTYTLTGSKNGGVSYSASESVSGSGSTVTYSDFEHGIGVDDIYTIKAHIIDLAGNEFESDITFSVNRFGSNFMIINPTTGERVNPVNPDDPNDFGFLSEAPEILIREVNVDPIDMNQSSVAVTYNLKTDYLNKVTDLSQPGFSLTESTTGNGWRSYDYTVSRSSFVGESNGSTDGSYQVEVSSYDSAANHNTSAQFWQEGAADGGNSGEHESSAVVKFTLDTTDPEIYGVSVGDGGVYANSGNYQVTFNAADNIGMKPEDIQVKLNGQNIEFTAVEGSSGQYAFNVNQGMLGFEDLVIEVKDYAGNTKTYHASFVDTFWPAFLAIGVAVVVAVGIAVGMRIRRRRIAEEDA